MAITEPFSAAGTRYTAPLVVSRGVRSASSHDDLCDEALRGPVERVDMSSSQLFVLSRRSICLLRSEKYLPAIPCRSGPWLSVANSIGAFVMPRFRSGRVVAGGGDDAKEKLVRQTEVGIFYILLNRHRNFRPASPKSRAPRTAVRRISAYAPEC